MGATWKKLESQSEGFQGFPLQRPSTMGKGPSPNEHHAGFVLCLAGPQGDLVPLGADVHDSSTHFPAVFLKTVSEQTQQLGPKECPSSDTGSTPPAWRPLPS